MKIAILVTIAALIMLGVILVRAIGWTKPYYGISTRARSSCTIDLRLARSDDRRPRGPLSVRIGSQALRRSFARVRASAIDRRR